MLTMGKVGILTFHRAINYGAVLQAYALNESIKNIGYAPVTIDYKNPHIEKIYDPIHFNYRSLKSFIGGVLTYNRRQKKKKSFEDFRTKFFVLDQISDLYDKKYIKHLNLYKKFLTGSDQVWNYAHTQFDKAYFLDFISDSSKKNSYAASFGFDWIPVEYVADYKKLLEDFNHISVREEQGAAIIKRLLNRKAEVVLDPTMLLSKNDWVKISEDYRREKRDYILIYQVATSQSLLDFAVNLSKETNREIICISDALRKRIKATYVAGVGPQEFLGLLKNAKYIITNSFHGTAFSINFNKLFFVEMLPPPAKVNSRLENILDTFNLRSRQIINGNNDNIFNEIDYTTVNKKLELERQRSLNYLKRILDEY